MSKNINQERPAFTVSQAQFQRLEELKRELRKALAITRAIFEEAMSITGERGDHDVTHDHFSVNNSGAPVTAMLKELGLTVWEPQCGSPKKHKKGQ